MGSGSAKEYIKHLLPPTTLASYIQYSMDTSSRMAGWWSEVCNFPIQLQLCLPAIPLGLEFSHPNHTHKTFSKLSSTHIFIIATSFSLSREGPQSLRRLQRRFVPLACFFPQAAPLYNSINFHFPSLQTGAIFIPFQVSYLLMHLLLNENSSGGIAVLAAITDWLMMPASFISFACLCPFPLLHPSISF